MLFPKRVSCFRQALPFRERVSEIGYGFSNLLYLSESSSRLNAAFTCLS